MLKDRGPGLALAAAGGGAALLVHALVPYLGTTLVAIVLGFGLGASGLVRARVRPGLAVVSRRVLRVGVALLGLELVLGDVLGLGWQVLVVVLAVVVCGILGTLALARALGVPTDQGLLVACGFSICGAAAVAAVEGVRRSREEDVARAVSLVVVFGSIAMLAVPALGGLLGLGQVAAGAWSGAAVHEVGQVVVAGGLLGGAALQVAVVVKLARVLMLAPVLAVVSWRSRREAVATGARPPLVPAFVLAFVGLAVLRSVLDVPAGVLDTAGALQSAALAAAMFALGCSVDPRALRRTGRPLVLLAAGATALVTVVALPAAYLV
ncbi:YeiH family protein [Nocardioides sp. zg-DK7169]|uniref:YeiH family protein n=1 Tax=Nocardioides sp. zg-DK7169 TaxID=2736600 RepID=UPI001551B06A|nr:putative sulfate exporter family transporter [Nocardioides sp. zg-DK7169]NPC96942.1 putative sulfate exporter family transporter [Nocardioides sp. zg-DK7169]